MGKENISMNFYKQKERERETDRERETERERERERSSSSNETEAAAISLCMQQEKVSSVAGLRFTEHLYCWIYCYIRISSLFFFLFLISNIHAAYWHTDSSFYFLFYLIYLFLFIYLFIIIFSCKRHEIFILFFSVIFVLACFSFP